MSSFNTDQLILVIPTTVGKQHKAQSCLLWKQHNSTEHLYLSFTNHILIPYKVQGIHSIPQPPPRQGGLRGVPVSLRAIPVVAEVLAGMPLLGRSKERNQTK